MVSRSDELLKRPLYVFDLPRDLLVSLQLKDSTSLPPPLDKVIPPEPPAENLSTQVDGEEGGRTSINCSLCGASFESIAGQRSHVKSDWHGYNLKQKLRGLPAIKEDQFDELVGDLDESISGSDSSTEEDEDEGKKESTLSALLKKQAKLHEGKDLEDAPKKRKRETGNAPLIWFSTPLLPANTSLGIYKVLFTEGELQNPNLVEVINKKQLSPIKSQTSQSRTGGAALSASPSGPKIFLCMIGGGHFAAMIVSLTPKIGKNATGNEERQAIVVAHKTFHRYTTRRKQGGSQSANDSAKGAAHSAGAGIRRYNEAALENEVRALLSEWKNMINEADLLFVRATGRTNRRTLFGPYEDQVLHPKDPRNCSFPFSTRRATQAELMRAFVELTRVKVSQIDEAGLALAAAEAAKREEAATKSTTTPSKPTPPKVSKQDEAALLHTSQLQALIRRSKGPAVLSYLSSNSLSPDFVFYPPTTQANHHSPTPLHLAASTNTAVVVLALLTKGGADPTVLNGEGKPPFDLAGDRATRDSFRVSRSQLGEDKWNWNAAHCPPAMTKQEADRRDESERKEVENAEAERRKTETERLNREALAHGGARAGKTGSGKSLAAPELTGQERREQEARGMTPEMRAKLERERRARAAEERIRRMAGGVGG